MSSPMFIEHADYKPITGLRASSQCGMRKKNAGAGGLGMSAPLQGPAGEISE
jgi:hypothetical protein